MLDIMMTTFQKDFNFLKIKKSCRKTAPLKKIKITGPTIQLNN